MRKCSVQWQPKPTPASQQQRRTTHVEANVREHCGAQQDGNSSGAFLFEFTVVRLSFAFAACDPAGSKSDVKPASCEEERREGALAGGLSSVEAELLSLAGVVAQMVYIISSALGAKFI